MTSIHCAPLLAAILLLIPAVLAQSVPTAASGQTILDSTLSADVALPTLGGQLSSGFPIAFAVAGDKAPNTVNTGAVTLGFTTANAVPINGQVIVTVPKGYFSNVDSTKVNTFSGTSSTCKCVGTAGTATTDVLTCTVAGATLAAGAVTLSMVAGALTTGAPTAAFTYNVKTTVDRELSSPPSTAQIGGVITIGAFSLGATVTGDKQAFTSITGTATLAFTVETQIPVGGKLTVSFPKNYISAVSFSAENTFANKPRATNCVLNKAAGTATVDTVVCTISADVLPTGTQTLTFVAGSITTGGPTTAVTGGTTAGIKVSSSTDRESVSGATTIALGGHITLGTFTAFTTDKNIPGFPNDESIEIAFQPANAVPIGGKITIALPPNYFRSVLSSATIVFTGITTGTKAKCVLIQGVTGTAVLGLDGYDTVVCTTSDVILASTTGTDFQKISFPAASVVLGAPQLLADFNIATSTDAHATAVASTLQLGSQIASAPGQVSAVNKPGLPSEVDLPFLFTPVTNIPAGGKITIALPANYLTAVNSATSHTVSIATTPTATTTTATCTLQASTGVDVAGIVKPDLVVCTNVGQIPKTKVTTLTLTAGSVTIGAPQLAGKFNIATSSDRPSAAPGTDNTPATGGSITGTPSLTLTDADKVPLSLNTAVVTVTFTISSDLPVASIITIGVPKGYFSKVDASKTNNIFSGAQTTAVTFCTCALTQASGVDVQDKILCTTSGAAVTADTIKLEFAVGTVTTGGAVASGTTLSVGTSTHFPATTGTFPRLGGANVVAGAALTFTQADDSIPSKFTANNNSITLGFKTSTASTGFSGGVLPIGGKITLTFPQNYFSKVDSTKENTVGTATTAKCALASATSSVSATIALDTKSVSTSATLTVSFVPATVTGVTQLAIPFSGFSLNSATASSVATCTANCGPTTGATVALVNNVLTLTLSSGNSFTLKNALTTFQVTLVTTPPVPWASTATATLFNPSTTVVCTTAGAAIAAGTTVVFTFVAGSVTIGSGQKASTFQIETSSDLPMSAAAATVALGGGLTGGKTLAFANDQDRIPGRVNSGPITLGTTLVNSVPIGGQFLLAFPSNYFASVNSASVVTLTKGTRRSLLQTSTLSCVRTAGATVDQITCTLAGAASGTGAVVLTFPAGSLTTGLPAVGGGYNIATANPPAAGAARVPYFPKAAGSAYGVAWLLVALSALLACF